MTEDELIDRLIAAAREAFETWHASIVKAGHPADVFDVAKHNAALREGLRAELRQIARETEPCVSDVGKVPAALEQRRLNAAGRTLQIATDRY